MSFFTSPREKRLWLYALVVLFIILLTLFVGRPFLELFESQDVQAALFMMGLLLVVATIGFYGFTLKPSYKELVVWLGFSTVFLLFFLRLGLAERSHLIEYCVLAIFIHQALLERKNNVKDMPPPWLLALLLTFFIGVIDECIQIFLPDRVFHDEDIIFNGLAALMAIGGSGMLRWIRKKLTPKNE